MPIVQMPDGAHVSFPDTMPPDQIKSMIVQKFPELDQSFSGKEAQSYNNRANDSQQSADAYQAGKQSLPETAAQITLNGVGGFIGDTVGNAVSALTPDIIKKGASSALNSALNSPIVTAGAAKIQPAYDQATQYLKDNPRTARNLNAAGNALNLASMVAAPEVAGDAGVGDAVANIGDKLVASGQGAADAARNDYIKSLVMPAADTPSARAKMVGRTSVEGPFQTSVIQPTKQELESASNVANIPDVSPKNTYQANYNAIKGAIGDEANSLSDSLSKIPVTDDHLKDLNDSLDDTINSIKSNDAFTGDAKAIGSSLAQKAKDIIDDKAANGPLTMSDLLDARKEFDQYLKNSKPRAFDATTENGFDIANRSVRDTLNNFVADNVQDVGVKQSLSKQSSLYRALDNVEDKAAKEAPTALGRLSQKLDNGLPVKNAMTKGAGVASGIGLGGAALFTHPALTLGATAGLAATKALTNPRTRIAVGKALQKLGHTTAEINKMKPAQALAILNQGRKK